MCNLFEIFPELLEKHHPLFSSYLHFVMCLRFIPTSLSGTIEQLRDLQLNCSTMPAQIRRKHTLKLLRTHHSHPTAFLFCFCGEKGRGCRRHVHTLPDPADRHPALPLARLLSAQNCVFLLIC